MERLEPELKRGICVLQCAEGHRHGVVFLQELSPGGPTRFTVFVEDLEEGHHGIHIHMTGNLSEGSTSLCDHYNPFENDHGGLNEECAHLGDLGNVYSNANREVETEFVADYVRLRGPYSVFGRSLVVHEDEDDLGRGEYEDSKTTGHSGERILWGIIAVDEDCS